MAIPRRSLHHPITFEVFQYFFSFSTPSSDAKTQPYAFLFSPPIFFSLAFLSCQLSDRWSPVSGISSRNNRTRTRTQRLLRSDDPFRSLQFFLFFFRVAVASRKMSCIKWDESSFIIQSVFLSSYFVKRTRIRPRTEEKSETLKPIL